MKFKQLTDYGQIQEGDLLLIEKTNGVVFPAIAKKIIYNGSKEREEIIYSKTKNYYFITSMVLDGSSGYVKSVVIVCDGKATSVINNMNIHY